MFQESLNDNLDASARQSEHNRSDRSFARSNYNVLDGLVREFLDFGKREFPQSRPTFLDHCPKCRPSRVHTGTARLRSAMVWSAASVSLGK